MLSKHFKEMMELMSGWKIKCYLKKAYFNIKEKRVQRKKKTKESRRSTKIW